MILLYVYSNLETKRVIPQWLLWKASVFKTLNAKKRQTVTFVSIFYLKNLCSFLIIFVINSIAQYPLNPCTYKVPLFVIYFVLFTCISIPVSQTQRARSWHIFAPPMEGYGSSEIFLAQKGRKVYRKGWHKPSRRMSTLREVAGFLSYCIKSRTRELVYEDWLPPGSDLVITVGGYMQTQ